MEVRFFFGICWLGNSVSATGTERFALETCERWIEEITKQLLAAKVPALCRCENVTGAIDAGGAKP